MKFSYEAAFSQMMLHQSSAQFTLGLFTDVGAESHIPGGNTKDVAGSIDDCMMLLCRSLVSSLVDKTRVSDCTSHWPLRWDLQRCTTATGMSDGDRSIAKWGRRAECDSKTGELF